MPEVIVLARVRPLASRRDELMELLAEVEAASRLDEGCVSYGYYTGVTDADDCVAVEHWADMAALEAHLAQPHVQRLIAALGDLLEGPPQIAAHQVASSGPLPLP